MAFQPRLDLVFDVRFLPNPHFVPEFPELDGRRSEGGQVCSSVPADEGVSG